MLSFMEAPLRTIGTDGWSEKWLYRPAFWSNIFNLAHLWIYMMKVNNNSSPYLGKVLCKGIGGLSEKRRLTASASSDLKFRS